MKILRVINSINPHSGGPIEGLKKASQVMLDADIEVEVVSLDQASEVQGEVDAMPWPVYALGPTKFGVYSYSNQLTPWLKEHLSRFDAVIIHGCWQFHGYAVSKACQKLGKPYYIYPHGMLDPWFNQTYPLKKLKKQLYWSWGEHPVLSKAKAVLFTCEEERCLARKSFSPYRVREHVIGYGTSIASEADSASVFTRPTPQPYFVFLGRVQEKKGVDLLVAAYSRLRSEHPEMPDLVIAGPEQQPEYAQSIKETFPLPSIHWIGPVNSTDKWSLLRQAAALTLVSHQENFGLVVAEALAMGTPVLISDKVNIWREIDEAGAGMVGPDTLEGAETILLKWIGQSSSEMAAMQRKAKQVFIEHFDIQKATHRLIDFLKLELDQS
ncbi:MAG: glycosyltransferase [Verrucomicrobiota bacterium]